MLTINYQNQIWKVVRDGQTLGQGRTLELALHNGISGAFPGGALFMAAEVLANLYGPFSDEAHGQIATKEPGG